MDVSFRSVEIECKLRDGLRKGIDTKVEKFFYPEKKSGNCIMG